MKKTKKPDFANEFLTAEQGAYMFDLHPQTLLRYVREGKIAGKRMGKKIYISKDAIRAYIMDSK